MNIRFNITPKDISLGCKGDAGNCPSARAIQRRFKAGIVVNVGLFSLSFYNTDKFCRIKEMPKTLHNFIKLYDDGQPVKPISFTLDVPEEFLK